MSNYYRDTATGEPREASLPLWAIVLLWILFLAPPWLAVIATV